MRKRIIELEMENEFLKGGDSLLQKRLKRYGFIDSEKAHYPIRVLCRFKLKREESKDSFCLK
jgi:hypothetical protein